ncbi:MAG TPA: hypothetical protein VGL70_14340 [Candidatus Binatia bacterium]|jgi:hypothetical protein
MGRREKKIIGGNLTEFLYDRANPIQETSASAVTANIAGLRIDEFFGRIDSTGTQHFLTDALGSVVATADSIGTLSTLQAEKMMEPDFTIIVRATTILFYKDSAAKIPFWLLSLGIS